MGEQAIIRSIWRRHFYEIGVYSVLVRYKWLVLPLMIVAIACAAKGYAIYWIFFWVLMVFGGIDHIIIGWRIRVVLRHLYIAGIYITKDELLKIIYRK